MEIVSLKGDFPLRCFFFVKIVSSRHDFSFFFIGENHLLKRRFLIYKFLLSFHWIKLRRFGIFFFYHDNLGIIFKNCRALIKNPRFFVCQVNQGPLRDQKVMLGYKWNQSLIPSFNILPLESFSRCSS